MVGIELVVRSLVAMGKSHTCFFIREDNRGAIEAIAKGSCRNTPSNAAIIRINSIRIPLNITILPSYVPSASNRADPVSRGDFAGLVRSKVSFPLPGELTDILVDVQ